ncbi:MAG: aminoglycoside phosphotransferase family protein [Dehalococcoidia bacterium]
MSFFIPTRVRETAAGFGAEGLYWLEHLPAHVTELEQTWSLTAGRAFDTDGQVSWVAPVYLQDGSDAVLKISIPHPEARHEADALRSLDGQGAVRLLCASEDGFSLLLERCVPGTNLWALDVEEGNAAGAAVLRQLWRELRSPVVLDSVSDLAAEWCESLPREAPAAGYDAALVARAVELARQLAATQPRTVLLHGDFHPGNVLSAAREPWLAIDPKPLVGDPAYDLAQWLGNRCEAVERAPDAAAAIRRQIDQFSDLLGLDPARIAGWAFVKSLGWDWGAPVARILRAALEA